MTEPTTPKANKKPALDIRETEEYKTLLHENAVLQDRITELEDLVRKLMVVEGSPLGFQNAKDIPLSPIDTLAAVKAANFPADKLAKFFMDSRNCKKQMVIEYNDGNDVTNWRVE
jgi:rhodanese-related sulfurtransferase